MGRTGWVWRVARGRSGVCESRMELGVRIEKGGEITMGTRTKAVVQTEMGMRLGLVVRVESGVSSESCVKTESGMRTEMGMMVGLSVREVLGTRMESGVRV